MPALSRKTRDRAAATNSNATSIAKSRRDAGATDGGGKRRAHDCERVAGRGSTRQVRDPDHRGDGDYTEYDS